ncbi:1-aminocyclopropane-1-carboxylate oxidase-like protein 5 [Forsythia ovata]|uniref:1-aminocyclopropane-1-carboxylate oxidase-like protein 5 n=1 Tax=Forsythia ovata TaxID=205694 RepID=A0ABD1TAW1_9LAMI
MESENKSETKPYDRLSELKSFDETKSDVKGLADSGITKVPHIFIQLQDSPDRVTTTPRNIGLSIPIIDLDGVDKDPIKYKEIVDKIRDASETWGFFPLVNHGIPESDMENMQFSRTNVVESTSKENKKRNHSDNGPNRGNNLSGKKFKYNFEKA